MFEIALDRRRAQQFVDALGFRKTLVDPEADIGREFQIDAVGDFAAQKFLVALESGDYFVGVATGFASASVTVCVVGLVIACVVLPIPIVIGYGVRAAAREDQGPT